MKILTTQSISKFIFFKILRWKFSGEFPKELKKFVIIGAPHTSWQDFPIAFLSRSIWGVKIYFMAKKSLFKPPFGFIFKALGGIPVDRDKRNNLVDYMTELFNIKDEFRLGLSPEGTRRKVKKWKTGFYHIAKGAKVPVVLFGFDFGKKRAIISKPYYPTDDIDKDFKYFDNFYKGIKGKND